LPSISSPSCVALPNKLCSLVATSVCTILQVLCSSLPALETLRLEIPSDRYPSALALLQHHPSLSSLELTLSQAGSAQTQAFVVNISSWVGSQKLDTALQMR
jgi:hypothetical protein